MLPLALNNLHRTQTNRSALNAGQEWSPGAEIGQISHLTIEAAC